MVGERVIFRHFKPEGEIGVVGMPDENTAPGEMRVVLPNGDFYYFRAHELEREPRPLVAIKQSFVVTIGQHDHELSEQDAYALFRALEKVL
jgi:hypothetical protein